MESTSQLVLNLSMARREEIETTTEDTFMEEVEAYTIFKIANFISIYWFPILVPLGLVGNSLSFVVMIKPNNRKNVNMYLHGSH